MRIIVTVVLLGFVFAWSGCESAPKKTPQQQVVINEHEKALSVELDRNVLKAYGQWKDASAERILNDLVDRLASADINYKETRGTRVHLLATTTPLIAPGLDKIIYVSKGVLGGVSYENELAYLLGTQLAFVKEHVTAKTLANLQSQEVGESLIKLPTAPPVGHRDYLESGWFEPGGLFDFGNVAYLSAEAQGIQLAYAAKYDPRGAVTLIQRWTNPPFEDHLRTLGKILPDADERLTQAREEVAKLSPLRDPIVKSHAFEELEARLHVKKAKTKKKTSEPRSEKQPPGTR